MVENRNSRGAKPLALLAECSRFNSWPFLSRAGKHPIWKAREILPVGPGRALYLRFLKKSIHAEGSGKRSHIHPQFTQTILQVKWTLLLYCNNWEGNQWYQTLTLGVHIARAIMEDMCLSVEYVCLTDSICKCFGKCFATNRRFLKVFALREAEKMWPFW